MKRFILCLALASVLLAQEEAVPEVENAVVVEETATPPKSPPKKGNDMRNWLFAAGSLVAATAAIVAVLWSPGATPPSATP